tara:strand:+ start:41 stop:448 length:408 start_codon:yes stop_codon:yes gene_type:complete
MKKLLIIIIFFSNTVFAEVINIGNEKLKMLLKQDIPIVDVRNKNEWETTGIISKSYLISMLNHNGKYSLENWYNQFSKIKLKNNSVVLICAVGGRSYYLAKIISHYKKNIKVYNVKKGIKNWIKFNNPVVKYNVN